MALTDVVVRALKRGSVRYLRSDDRGLYIEVLPSGEKSWLYRYRLAGKPGKVSLGRYPLMSLKQARDERDAMRALVQRGRSPVEERRQAKLGHQSDPTVREFGTRYYREYVEKRWKTPTTVLRYLENEIYPTLGNKALKDVTSLDVQALVYRKRDNGRPAAAMHLRNVLKQMYDYAVEVRLVAINPAAMVALRFIGKARRRTRALSPKEIRHYLHVLYRSNVRRQFKLALHIILLTLVRKSALLRARWEHVDFDAGEWSVPEEHSKNGRPHIVYMSNQVSAMFRELKSLAGTSELVLPGRGSTVRPFSVNALNKALEGLTFEMEPFTIHDSRRTAGTLLEENGFDKDVVEKALNHEKQGIRAVYIVAEYAPERKRMLQWWADYVDDIMNESKVIMGSFGARG